MKYMNSIYYGKCSACERKVTPGERIAWLSKGTIECSDCMAPENTADSAPQPAQATNAVTGDSWADALAWDASKPEPGASIGQANGPQPPAQIKRIGPEKRAQALDSCEDCGKLDELSHNDHTGTALCGDCDDAANNAAKFAADAPEYNDAQIKRNVTRIDTRKPERLPEIDPQTQTVADLLVTLVNAVTRLDSAQRMELHNIVTGYAESTAGESRRAIWRGLSNIA